jgi:hypothetical protein
LHAFDGATDERAQHQQQEQTLLIKLMLTEY